MVFIARRSGMHAKVISLLRHRNTGARIRVKIKKISRKSEENAIAALDMGQIG
jgi:hypothetical protein